MIYIFDKGVFVRMLVLAAFSWAHSLAFQDACAPLASPQGRSPTETPKADFPQCEHRHQTEPLVTARGQGTAPSVTCPALG